MAQKLHDSSKWLKYQHYNRGKSIEAIAKMCGVQPLTIRRKFEQFGIKIAK